jgi:hypothetical protein
MTNQSLLINPIIMMKLKFSLRLTALYFAASNSKKCSHLFLHQCLCLVGEVEEVNAISSFFDGSAGDANILFLLLF